MKILYWALLERERERECERGRERERILYWVLLETRSPHIGERIERDIPTTIEREKEKEKDNSIHT